MKTPPRKTSQKFLNKALRIISGFTVLIALQLLSEYLLRALHINFPPTIFGMIIFALLLHFKIIPIWLIKEACTCAIMILPSLFVPLLVGVSVHFGLIKENLPVIGTILIVATFVTMGLTAIFVDKVMEFTTKKEDEAGAL